MEENVFKMLFGVFTEFTWRKFFALVSVVVVFFILVSLYERYTSSFLLGRLQKSAELIAKIQEIEVGITNSSPALRQDYDALVAQASDAIRDKPLSLAFIPSTLRLQADTISKFFAGGALWFLFAVLVLVMPRGRDETNAIAAFSGLVLLGIVVGLVGIFVPALWWPWFHIFVYPFVVLFILICSIVLLITLRDKFRRD